MEIPIKQVEKGTFRALVLTADKFEDLELFVPYFRLLEAGGKVDIAGPTTAKIGGKHGYEITPNLSFDEARPDDYALLVIPGGRAPAVVRRQTAAQQIARSFFEKNKPVASICHGPWLLVSANLVRGRHLTSVQNDGVPEEIKEAGGLWEDSEVVVDGNLVTSRLPKDLHVFTREMMRLVAKSR